MDIIYTELQLLRYYYSETDLFETLEIEHSLEEDIDFRFEYKMLVETLNELPKAGYTPSQSSVNNILAYSKVS